MLCVSFGKRAGIRNLKRQLILWRLSLWIEFCSIPNFFCITFKSVFFGAQNKNNGNKHFQVADSRQLSTYLSVSVSVSEYVFVTCMWRPKPPHHPSVLPAWLQSCDFDEFDSLWAFALTAGYIQCCHGNCRWMGGLVGVWAEGHCIDSSGKPQPTTSVHRACLPMDRHLCNHAVGAMGRIRLMGGNCCCICINFELIAYILGP